MYPYYEKDLKEGSLTREYAQELIDCIWVKLNDLNKCRDAASAEGFAGYSLFQNLIVGGQTVQGRDATNEGISGNDPKNTSLHCQIGG